jgi:hypothetical protein
MTGARFFSQQDVDSIAHELSSIDYELYRSIEGLNITFFNFFLQFNFAASELMNKNWQRENATELSFNLVCLRKRFNQLSFWVISMVLKSDSKEETNKEKNVVFKRNSPYYS